VHLQTLLNALLLFSISIPESPLLASLPSEFDLCKTWPKNISQFSLVFKCGLDVEEEGAEEGREGIS